MIENDFISNIDYKKIEKGITQAQCPSNIALIKYWGKFENQIPANSSLSYTLTESFTKTTLSFEKSKSLEVELFLQDQKNENFSEKIKKYLFSIKKYLPFIDQYKYTISTHNTFPHSSGIASSASGFAALAVCLVDMEIKLGAEFSLQQKLQKESFLARLGSGSACRSIYKGITIWGEHPEIPKSTNLYAIPYPFEVAPIFKTLNDTILLIDEGQKKISSTMGHGLMKNHPYAENRFHQANKNLSSIANLLKIGDIKAFGEIIEHEALSLHAMMMTSKPSFLLMKPMTLAVINKIWDFRKYSQTNLYFTLDAGANIHLIYPQQDEPKVLSFIKNELLKYTENGKYLLNKLK